jgi:hypothetical protein
MPVELPSLFDAFNAKAITRRKIVTCARELRKLAARRGSFGVTADDTRRIAIAKGLTTGREADLRALSWMAAVPKTARLHRTEGTRTNAQRNAQRIFVL